jgi:RHS repeat-associated protein
MTLSLACLRSAASGLPPHSTGKERDTESGNDNFGARYYSSSMGRWLSPDWSAKVEPVPYAKLDNPQSLNLYAYVGNNPLIHIDVDGHYECSGTKDQCAAIKTALQVVRNADANLKAGTSGKAMLDKVLKFYGAEGEKNGVGINFSNSNPRSLGSTSTENGVTTISFGKNSFARMGPTGKGETIAHEGTHGVDNQKNPAQPMPKTFWQFYDTEYHAYQAESAVDKGLGARSETDNPPVWAPGISSGQRTLSITQHAYSNAQFDCDGGGCQ